MEQHRGLLLANLFVSKNQIAKRIVNSGILSCLALFLAVITACSGPSSDTTPAAGTHEPGPQFTSVNPKSDESDVALNTKIIVTFNKALDPQSVAHDAIMLFAGSDTTNAPITGDISYSDSGGEYVVTFTPISDLKSGELYTVVITNAITDVNGNRGFFSQYTFTTIAKPTNDTVAPMVSSTIPVNGNKAFAVNSAVVVNFSEAMDVASIDTNSFYLQANGSSTNVSGTVNYSSGSAKFTPSSDLQANTDYTATVTTAVTDLAGNHLASDYTWSFTTAAATNTDTTPPAVSVVTPRNNASNVAVNTAMSVGFTETLNATTVNDTSFTLSYTDTNSVVQSVAGTVNYSGTTATFKPTADLIPGTVYTATLTTAIKDLSGNALANDYSWTFTTVTAPVADTIPPVVTAVSPLIGSIAVATNTSVSAQFSEALDPLTVNSASFLLKDSTGTAVAGSINYNGVSATFTPLAGLQNATTYTATLTADIADLAGNTLSANYAWSFSTSAAADLTAPTVVSKDPADLATGVVTNTAVNAVFSEALDPGTVSTSTFTLTNQSDGSQIAGVVHYSGLTATFTPILALPVSTFTATLTTGITDLAGNALAQAVTWSFTTVNNTDTTPPQITALSPARGAVNVAITINAISATFNEALDPSTVNNASMDLTRAGFPVAGSVSYDSATSSVIFTPSGNLAFATTYTATIYTTVTDLAGNPLAQAIIWSFTTRNPGGMGGGGG